MTEGVPSGVWAVASALRSRKEIVPWAKNATSAASWTFRRPICSEKEALASLAWLRQHSLEHSLDERATVRPTNPSAGKFLAVHGRFDWARAVRADAVITGWDSLPAKYWKDLRGPLLLGCSAHSPDEMETARQNAADFVIYGPVWSTPSKRGLVATVGMDGLCQAVDFGIPVIAIGGIQSAEQVEQCRQAGARGVAVLRAALDSEQLRFLQNAWSG